MNSLTKAALAAAALVLGAAGAGAPRAPAAVAVSTSSIAVVTLESQRAVVRVGDEQRLPIRRGLFAAQAPVLSPDGAKVAYAVRSGDGLEIRVARSGIGGRRTAVARVPGPTVALAFAPDGRRVAVASTAGIQIAQVEPAAPARVLRLPTSWRGSRYAAPAFSSDGRLLAVNRSWGDGREGTLRNEVAVLDLERTGAPTTLYRNPDPFSSQPHPVFSPNGTTIAFRIGERALALVPATGGPLRRLTTPSTTITVGDPLWSPDGTRLAFWRTPDRGVSDIWIVSSQGGPPHRVTTTPIPLRGIPHVGSSPVAWSPDGARLLAFRHDRFAIVDVATRESHTLAVTGVEYTIASARWVERPSSARRLAAAGAGELVFTRGGDLYSIRAGGSGLERLTRTRAVEGAPAWSPDGAQLAYNAGGTVSSQIFVRDAAGGRTRAITRGPGQKLGPSWSPDGKSLAFAGNRSGAYELYVVNADGTGLRQLTRLGGAPGGSFSPAWSPGGRTIVFSSSARTPENPELYSIRPDGTALRRLTRTLGDAHRLGDDGMPAWSPDGRTIVFTSNRTGNGEIWTMRPNGSGQRRLVGFPRRDDWFPRVSPDGTTIAFASFAARTRDVYLANASGRNVRLLVRNASEPSWRP